MRKLAIAMALASTALATPALARDKTWYVGVEGGAMIVEDIKFDIAGVTAAGNGNATINHDYGYDVDGVIGYDFGPVRIETEVGYKSAVLDSYASSVGTPNYLANRTSLGTAPAGTFNAAGGRTSAL